MARKIYYCTILLSIRNCPIQYETVASSNREIFLIFPTWENESCGNWTIMGKYFLSGQQLISIQEIDDVAHSLHESNAPLASL